MSFILDALRKAERERNIGRAPSLEDVTHPVRRSPAAARSWRPLALLGLVLGLLLLTYLLWPSELTETNVASPANLPAAAPAESSAPPAPTPAPVDPPEAALDESVQAESLRDLVDGSVVNPAPAQVPRANAPAPTAGVAPSQVQAPAEPEPAPEPESETGTAHAEPVDPEPLLAPPSAAAVGISSLRDMPEAYRNAFPQLRVDVHVYDADPARRWVLIDGTKYLEGSTLTQGPRLQSITVDGIVFEFNGQTVLLPIRR